MNNNNYIWDKIRESQLPILIYGTGDGADKMLSYMAKINIAPKAFIVSDDFFRNQIFKGYPCYTAKMAEYLYPNYICLIAFGTRLTHVIDNINNIGDSHELYMPPFPLFGDDIFDYEYYTNHIYDIEKAKSLFFNDKSKKIIDNIVTYRLTGKLEYLYEIMENDSNFSSLNKDYTAYIDLGAYRGDTLTEAITKYRTIKKCICFEPAKNPFKKLEQMISCFDQSINISLLNKGAWDKDDTLYFLDGGGKGSHISENNIKSNSGAKSSDISLTSIDNVCNYKGEKLLIKYDVEGCEEKALLGSIETIRNNNTDLVISIYHKSSDIFSIPLLISKLFPDSKMSIKKLYGIPDWDILLYVET